jgi:hypothetical protein
MNIVARPSLLFQKWWRSREIDLIYTNRSDLISFPPSISTSTSPPSFLLHHREAKKLTDGCHQNETVPAQVVLSPAYEEQVMIAH